jgi:class 3 adenylate cyclase
MKGDQSLGSSAPLCTLAPFAFGGADRLLRHDPDVDAILQSLGMAELAALFAAEDIDATVLPSLQDNDLREIGLSLGQRKKLLAYLKPEARSVEQSRPGSLPEPELRRLSVLFCDLVGYTELTTRIDPDDVRTVLEAYYAAARQAAKAFGGYVAGYQGDGVILLFGFPVTQEEIAVRAVGAAHALQAHLSAQAPGTGTVLSARIGIASGRAIVGYPAGAGTSDLQMVGPVVNRAARLQTVAQPGMVVVDQATKDQAASGFAFAALPDAQLKGFEELVAVSQALPPSSTAMLAKPKKSAPQSAHQAELATLRAVWPPVGDIPVPVLVSGEAGIGKSTLLAQMLGEFAAKGIDVLQLTCNALTAQTPLRPVIDLIERQLSQSTEPRLTVLKGMLAPASAEEVKAVAIAMGLASLDPWDNSSPQEIRKLLIATLGRYLIGTGPRLVLVEDIHWADPTTRELLRASADLSAEGGCMLVATSRSEEDPLWADLPHRMHLRLAALPSASAETVLKSFLEGRVLPEKIVQSILARSDGNPLMIEAQARTVLARSELALGAAFEVPSSIYECLSARIEGLQTGRKLAAALAVFDAPTELSVLSAALQASQASLDDAVIELVRAGIVEVAEAPRPSLRFCHNLYREVCYERLVKSERGKLHLAAFRVLSETLPDAENLHPGLMALHAQEGGDHARAAPLAISAGEQAMQRSALIEADHFFSRAAEALKQLPQSRQTDLLLLKVLLAQASISRARLGIFSDSVGQLTAQVLGLARKLGDVKSELIALNGLYAHALVRADYPAARNWGESLRDAAEGAQDQTFQMIALRALGVVAFHTGALAEAESVLRQALDSYDVSRHLPLAHLHGYDHAEICSAMLSFTLWIKGDLAGAAEVGAFSISHSRRIGHMHSLVQALVFQSMLAALKGDTGATEAFSQEAEALAGKHGFASMLGGARFFDLLGRLTGLDRPAAEDEISALFAKWEEFKLANPFNYRPITGALLAAVCIRAKAFAHAEAVLAEAEAVQSRSGEIFAWPELTRQRARLMSALGEAEGSWSAFLAARAKGDEMGAGAFSLRLACDLAEAKPSPETFELVERALSALASVDDCWDVRRAHALLSAAVSA